MSSHEMNPEWVLSSHVPRTNRRALDNDDELIAVARRLWPRIQAHARRELANKSYDEAVVLATEIWEGVLRSVAKTLQRSNGERPHIADLDAYLFGAFRHRFNRALRKERRREETIKLVPSTSDLELMQQAHDSKSVRDLERSIQVKEALQSMDEWTRKVWTARQYGYSWREIAKHLRLTEPQAKLRFRYAIGKLRARLGYRP